jgi:L-ribulose-5-phosphate 3-epimerase UlaE
MIKAKDGDFFVTDWLRNRNTLEYLGIWEKVNNPNFNYGEFAIIKNKSGLNNFKISVKEFAERTNAIGLQAKANRMECQTKISKTELPLSYECY